MLTIASACAYCNLTVIQKAPAHQQGCQVLDRGTVWFHGRYWVRHATAAWLELLLYAVRRRRMGVLLKSAAAETLYFGIVYMLWRWQPVQTLWVFILPYIVTSAAFMFGNW